MEKRTFDSWVETFLNALREKRLLVIIDSSSKAEKAQFRIVLFDPDNGFFFSCASFLRELGFKQSKLREGQFICYCAGRYSFYILDRIGELLSERVENFDKSEYFKLISGRINVA